MRKLEEFPILIALTLLTAHFKPTLTADPCVSTVPDDIKPIRENSKYLIKNNYGKPNSNPTINDVKEACEKAGLVLPAIDHIIDWRSIQELIRDYKKSKSETSQDNRPFATGVFYDKNLGWVDIESKTKSAFVVWDYHEPDLTDETTYMNLLARQFDGKWYLLGANTDVTLTSPSTEYPVFCQYPRNNKCFKDSKEEEDFKALESRKDVDKMVDIGATHDFIWKMNTLPKSYDDSTQMCDSDGYQLWDGDQEIFQMLSTRPEEQLLKLRGLVKAHLLKLDLTPLALFYGPPDYRASFTRYQKDADASDIFLESAEFGKSNFFAICYADPKLVALSLSAECESNIADIPPYMNPIRPHSKYLIKENYEKPSPNPTLKEVEESCKKIGLVMPAIDHIVDWKSLQKLLREYKSDLKDTVENNPFAIGAIHDKDKGWVDLETQTKETFVIWDYGEPDITPETSWMNLAARQFDGRWYIAAADVHYELGGQIYAFLCQYPRDNKCFKQSHEEQEFKELEDAKKVDELLDIGESADFLWMMNTLPKSYEDSKTECEKEEGFVLWNADSKLMEHRDTKVQEQMTEVRTFVEAHLQTHDLYPKALFYGPPGERATFKKYDKYTDPAEIYLTKANIGKSKLLALCVYEFPDHCDPP